MLNSLLSTIANQELVKCSVATDGSLFNLRVVGDCEMYVSKKFVASSRAY